MCVHQFWEKVSKSLSWPYKSLSTCPSDLTSMMEKDRLCMLHGTEKQYFWFCFVFKWRIFKQNPGPCSSNSKSTFHTFCSVCLASLLAWKESLSLFFIPYFPHCILDFILTMSSFSLTHTVQKYKWKVPSTPPCVYVKERNRICRMRKLSMELILICACVSFLFSFRSPTSVSISLALCVCVCHLLVVLQDVTTELLAFYFDNGL